MQHRGQKTTVGFLVDYNVDGYDLLSVYSVFNLFSKDVFELIIIPLPTNNSTESNVAEMDVRYVETVCFWGVNVTAPPNATLPQVDIIVIPAIDPLRSLKSATTRRFLTSLFLEAEYVLTICFGSAIPASLGFLDGQEATGTRAVFDALTTYGPKVCWVRNRRWVSSPPIKQKFWSSSGASAGVDMAANFIAWFLGGTESSLVRDATILSIENGLGMRISTDPADDPFAVQKTWFGALPPIVFVVDRFLGIMKMLQHVEWSLLTILASTLKRPAIKVKPHRAWGKKLNVVILGYDGVDANTFATFATNFSFDIPNCNTYSVKIGDDDGENTISTGQGLKLLLEKNIKWLYDHSKSIDVVVIPDLSPNSGAIMPTKIITEVKNFVSSAHGLEVCIVPKGILDSDIDSKARVFELKHGFLSAVCAFIELSELLKTDGAKSSLDFAEIHPMNRKI
ncbi:hypothetical protein HK100_003449 [Physocladia obscura]|uniref:DJ-1/PfpI domain-containing protein n=1 Tax=Physocladia obscura TaxID=109957 RepID=A0AAD5SVQ5_9FUNG|nr:hypothetical protein HK100_003449 [Physocladia obscura]